jgi:CheY-like chemotaxis protein/HPt (histidine-containing phosphotransfer) domain-containing protein
MLFDWCNGGAQVMEQSLEHLRVLLVEDDTLIRQIASTILRRIGCDVVSASNGQEALEYVGEQWDLVLMDCQMPILDGFESTRRWRHYEVAQKAQRTLIVALTAETLPEELQHCIAVGMDDILSKPLSAAKVQALIKQWTTRREDSQHQVVLQEVDLTSQDVETFRELLQEYKGYEEVLVNLIQGFLRGLPKDMRLLQDALERKDTPLILQHVHKLKGGLLTLHAHSAVRHLSDLERQTRDGATIHTWSYFHSLEKELDSFTSQVKIISTYLSRKPPTEHIY